MSDDYEPTGIDLVLKSAAKIATRLQEHAVEHKYIGPVESFNLLNDMRASYLTYLYECQEADEHG